MQTGEQELRELMIGGLEGDAAAHAALLSRLVSILRQYYRRRANGSDDDIEDLVQETLIAVHTRRVTYDRARPFTAWLFAIARYKMIDHFRRVRRLQPLDDLENELLAEGFEDSSGAMLDINEMLDTLPPKQARSIRATRIEGLSIAEAAAAQGLGESDVKVSVHRGLKTLKARIREARQ